MKKLCCPTEKMITDYRTKPTREILFEFQKNAMLGVKKEDVGMCKAWCRRVLERHDLWDAAKDNACDV